MVNKENNSKGLFIPLTVVITLLLASIPVGVAYGKLAEKVTNLEISDNDKTETIKNIENRVDVLESIASGTEVSLDVIKSDVQEIKEDLKDIAKALQ